MPFLRRKRSTLSRRQLLNEVYFDHYRVYDPRNPPARRSDAGSQNRALITLIERFEAAVCVLDGGEIARAQLGSLYAQRQPCRQCGNSGRI
jgi:hypothetical protein